MLLGNVCYIRYHEVKSGYTMKTKIIFLYIALCHDKNILSYPELILSSIAFYYVM